MERIPEMSERLSSCTEYYRSIYIHAHKTSLAGWFLTSIQRALHHSDSNYCLSQFPFSPLKRLWKRCLLLFLLTCNSACFKISSPDLECVCVCVCVVFVCFCVCWPGQRGGVEIACLFTQQEVPFPLHPLITPAAGQTQLLTHTHTHAYTRSKCY